MLLLRRQVRVGRVYEGSSLTVAPSRLNRRVVLPLRCHQRRRKMLRLLLLLLLLLLLTETTRGSKLALWWWLLVWCFCGRLLVLRKLRSTSEFAAGRTKLLLLLHWHRLRSLEIPLLLRGSLLETRRRRRRTLLVSLRPLLKSL